MIINEYNQPIGDKVENYKFQRPDIQLIEGIYCRLERIDPVKHLEDLYEVYGPDSRPENWTYLSLDSFTNKKEFKEYLESLVICQDPMHIAIIDIDNNKALGTVSLMRIDSKNGVVEVGFVIYSDQLKKTRIATEAQYLLASYVFDKLNYRRYEWKCDSLNKPSIKAAERLGFTYEGCFRKAVVYKGRSRDTSWFSIIDSEWDMKKKRLELWLDPTNFNEQEQQKIALQKINLE